jgi:hypothetical protein
MDTEPRDLHVVAQGPNWVLVRDGSDRVLRTFWTKDEALELARQQAAREGVDVVVHRRDGSIEELDSFVAAIG